MFNNLGNEGLTIFYICKGSLDINEESTNTEDVMPNSSLPASNKALAGIT